MKYRQEVLKIIPYQVITGNYSTFGQVINLPKIIPYQVITGNYSIRNIYTKKELIIPYQVITGNYSLNSFASFVSALYHTK